MKEKARIRTIAKRPVSVILMFVIALTILLGKSQNVHAEVGFLELTASNATLYESGCLKSLDISIQADGYYAEAYGKIAIHSDATSYSWDNRYIESDNQTTWSGTIDDSTMIAISDSEFKWSDGDRCTVTVTFPDNAIPVNENNTYRVYLWTRAVRYGIYPDKEFPSLSTGDDGLKLGDKVIELSQTTHNHTNNYGLTTTNTSNDTLTWYCSETGCTSGATSAETAKKLTLVAPTSPVYSGNAESCTLTGKDDFVAATGAIVSDIAYYKKGETTALSSAPSEVGIYVAKVTATDSADATKTVTAEVEFSITGTVAYESNGGTSVPSVQGIALPATLPTPTRDGFTFDGWFTDRELTTEAVAGAAITNNITLYAKWTEKPSAPVENDVKNTTDTSTNAYEGNLAETDENVEDKCMENLSPEETAAINAGADVSIFLKVTELADNAVPETDKNEIEKNLGDSTFAAYIDLSLYRQLTGCTATKLTSTSEEVTITLVLPDSLKNTDATKTRTYKIARCHEGKVDMLDCSYSEGKISFATDKFSTYAIVYTDTVVTPVTPDPTITPPENPPVNPPVNPSVNPSVNPPANAPVVSTSPATGDSTPIIWMFISMVMAGIGVVVTGRKGKED